MKEYAHELHQLIQESQPWLAGITEEQAQSVPGTKWMIKEIVGHLRFSGNSRDRPSIHIVKILVEREDELCSSGFPNMTI